MTPNVWRSRRLATRRDATTLPRRLHTFTASTSEEETILYALDDGGAQFEPQLPQLTDAVITIDCINLTARAVARDVKTRRQLGVRQGPGAQLWK